MSPSARPSRSRRRWRPVHPSRRRLQEWLDGASPELASHVEYCDRCATRLEDMATPALPLAAALRDALRPPADLAPRLTAGISAKLQARADLGLLGDLLSTSWRTVRLLVTDDPPEERPT